MSFSSYLLSSSTTLPFKKFNLSFPLSNLRYFSYKANKIGFRPIASSDAVIVMDYDKELQIAKKAASLAAKLCQVSRSITNTIIN